MSTRPAFHSYSRIGVLIQRTPEDAGEDCYLLKGRGPFLFASISLCPKRNKPSSCSSSAVLSSYPTSNWFHIPRFIPYFSDPNLLLALEAPPGTIPDHNPHATDSSHALLPPPANPVDCICPKRQQAKPSTDFKSPFSPTSHPHPTLRALFSLAMAPAATGEIAPMHLPVCPSKPSKISASVLHGPRDLRLVSATSPVTRASWSQPYPTPS